jgi:hypothetical protein
MAEKLTEIYRVALKRVMKKNMAGWDRVASDNMAG